MIALACAVSPDGRLIAVRRGTVLSLHAIDPAAGTPGAVVAEASATGDGVLVFASACLLEIGGEATTRITPYSVPKLARRPTIEVAAATRVVAETGRHVLLAAPDQAFVVAAQGETVGYAPVRVAAAVAWAAGIGEDQFLVSSSRGVEVWEAGARRPLHKVRLALPAQPRAVGVATQRTNLWLATARPELVVVRISDGKPSRVPLPAVPEAPVGHPGSSWLVADLDGAPHAINLVTAACEALPAAATAARAIAPRGSGALYAQVAASGELELWELGGAVAAAGAGGLTLDVGAGGAAAAPVRTVTGGAAPTIARVAAPAAASGGVALRPDVGVELGGGPDGDEPVPVARYVAGETARRLAGIAEAARRAWGDVVRAQWLAGAIDRGRALEAVLAEVRRAADAAGLRVDGGRVTLPGPLLEERVASPWSALRLVVGDAIACELPIDDRDLPAIADALARLAAGADAAALRGDVIGRRILDAASDAGLVDAAPARATFAGQLEADTVVTLGGHTLLANLAGAHVLVDPRLAPGRPGDALPAPAVRDLPRLDAIVLTSDDSRCLDPGTLLQLPTATPVLVAPLPRLAALVADLGFSAVRELTPGDSAPVGDGGAVDALATGVLLRGRRGAALATGPAVLDADTIAALTSALEATARTAGPVSPLFLAAPARPRAPIERGWRWLLDAPDTWLAPRLPARLTPLCAAARTTTLVLCTPDAAVPADLGPDARRVDPYDRYRLGAGQDGWLEPRP